MNTEITIFTDGSSRGNPGPGGWGSVIVSEKEVLELGGREEHTTNNRMELTAAIEGVKHAVASAQIFSDSSYVINGITKWVQGWQKNNWITSLKKPVENRDLWEQLVEAIKGKAIEWKYVGGHVGIKGNERCDEIATGSADGQKVDLYKGSIENYPVKNILDINFDSVLLQKKKSSSSRSKAKAYSYISMINGEIQTHKTWAECEKRVKGAKGAKYQKSLSPEDETSIISSWKKV